MILENITEKKLSTATKANVMKWIKQAGVELHQTSIDELRNNPTIKPNNRVVLYRGLLFDKLDITSNKFKYNTDKPSSWSKDYDVACRFGKYSELNTDSEILASFFVSMRRGQIDRNIGIVIKYEFNPNDILLDCDLIPNKMSGRKFEYEKEVIVSPIEATCEIVTIFTKKGTYTPKEYLNRSLDNGYDAITKYLKSGLKDIDIKTIKECEKLFGGYSDEREVIDDITYIKRCLSFDKKVAYNLYKQFHNLNKSKPELIVAEYGSDGEKQYDKLREIYRYLSNFDSTDPSNGFSRQFTDYYYESEMISDLFNKKVDRLTYENRKKFSVKIEKMFSTTMNELANKYSFCSTFKGNVLFRMHQIVTGIKDI
jgi:hypothetical protein